MRSLHSQKPTGSELRIYVSQSKSYANSLVNFYSLNQEEIDKRIDYLLTHDPSTFKELNDQMFLHLEDALNGDCSYSPLGKFIFDITPLVEMYYQDFLWNHNKTELAPIAVHDRESIIVDDLLVNSFEHFLLYGHFTLGLNSVELADNWYSQQSNIRRKLYQLYRELGPSL